MRKAVHLHAGITDVGKLIPQKHFFLSKETKILHGEIFLKNNKTSASIKETKCGFCFTLKHLPAEKGMQREGFPRVKRGIKKKIKAPIR